MNELDWYKRQIQTNIESISHLAACVQWYKKLIMEFIDESPACAKIFEDTYKFFMPEKTYGPNGLIDRKDFKDQPSYDEFIAIFKDVLEKNKKLFKSIEDEARQRKFKEQKLEGN